ncbi:MAG: glutamate--tRNA ligase family protein [Desulfobulbaceae bacterium]
MRKLHQAWLGFDWQERLYFASDYFEKFYEFALFLIKKGRAYVDSLSAEEMLRRRILTISGC